MFDRRLAQNFDWILFGLALIVAGIGLVVLYSAVTAGTQTAERALFNRQLMWYGIGLGVMVFSFFFDYKHLDRFAPAIYVGTILLLVMVKIYGKTVGGGQRWLDLGPISIQPSEIAKLTVIIVLARYYSRVPTASGYTLRELGKPLLVDRNSVCSYSEAAGPGHGDPSGPDRMRHDGVCQDRATNVFYTHGGLRFHLPRCMVFSKGLSTTTYFNFSKPGSGSPRGRVSYHSVENRHRLRNAVWKGLPPGNPECPVVSAGTTYGFHLFSFSRRVGFYGVGGRSGCVLIIDYLRTAHSLRVPGYFRDDDSSGGDGNAFLAGDH